MILIPGAGQVVPDDTYEVYKKEILSHIKHIRIIHIINRNQYQIESNKGDDTKSYGSVWIDDQYSKNAKSHDKKDI